MRLATTIVLFALVASLVVFVARYEQTLPSTHEKLAIKVLPFEFDEAKVDHLEITGKDLAIRMKKVDGAWMMRAPYEDRADQKEVAQLLTLLTQVEWMETLNRKDLKNGDWKRAGLSDNGSVEIAIFSGDNLLAQAKFGNPGVIEGSVYAVDRSRDGNEIVHLAKAPVAVLLRAPADAWRDRKLLSLSPDGIRRFVMSAGTGVLEFVREPQQSWMIVKPLQTRASNERVNAVIGKFLNLEAKPQIEAPTRPLTAADASAPVMKISITHDSLPNPLQLTFLPTGETGADPLVTVSDRPGVFSAPPKIVDIWKLQPNMLRDQRLVRLDPEKVTALRIRSGGFPEIMLDKSGSTWMLSRRGTSAPANGERLQRLFENLNKAMIREFPSDAPANLAAFGLKSPFVELEWQSEGHSTVLQFGQNDQNATYAKYSNEPFVYRIDQGLLAFIPPDTARWRSLSVLNLSIFSLHRIVISELAKPATILNYDPDNASWTAEIAGKDVTSVLIKPLANDLLSKISNLQAADWVSDRSLAYQALKQPSLTMQLLVGDPSKPNEPARPMILTFAPTTAKRDTAMYHGRIEGDPETFLITRERYRQLTRPVVKTGP